MRFGPVPTDQAEGAILAHSLNAGELKLRKGRTLGAGEITALLKANIFEVTVARLEAGDLGEDEAAESLANTLIPDADAESLRLSAPFTGRVNAYAEKGGVLCVDAAAINRFNAISPEITVATLPDMTRVSARSLVATVKIIPYGVPASDVAKSLTCSALSLKPFKVKTASLILTQTADANTRLLEKGRAVVEQRLQAFGCELSQVLIVPHEVGSLAAAIAESSGEAILILTSSATSDLQDVGPSALTQSGGSVTRFGMPVDPGNLLFVGDFSGRPVIGLPGCARSPTLNGADWVLERVMCGLEVTDKDIAGMGVGGLLKEIPSRPQPRAVAKDFPSRPRVEVLLLAAGGSQRMRGRDKLLEMIDGDTLLQRSVSAALASTVDRVHVVLPPENEGRVAALKALDVSLVRSPEWQEGMAASIRSGMESISSECDAVIVALADMPDVTCHHFDKLVAAFDPSAGREICRAVTEDGSPGLPVLFGRRFFESLASLRGDRGARDVVKDAPDFLVDVLTKGQGAVIDLDTPEAWDAWRAKRSDENEFR